MYLSQTIWIQRILQGAELEDGIFRKNNETDEEFKKRIEDAIYSAVKWYANLQDKTLQSFLDSTIKSGSDKPFDEIVMDMEGQSIIVSEKINVDLQCIHIFNNRKEY